MVRFEKPIYRDLGDLYIGVEYGDTYDVRLSFKVNALNLVIKARRIKGILETIPTVHTLGIVYNPFLIEKRRLIEELKRIEMEERLNELTELPSRLIRVPVWFNDPWSDECAKAHGMENNLEFITKTNGVSIDEVIRIYTSTRYWTAGVNFLLGTFSPSALEPLKITLKVPKWSVPRKWTYERTIGIAGTSVAIYSIRAPGGYHMVGRTPIDIYDPQQRNPIFKEDVILAKPTDRVEFYPISEAEYYLIRREVEEGTYHYQVEEGVYFLGDYKGE